MILNVYTVIAVALAGAGGLVALGVLMVSTRSWFSDGETSIGEGKRTFEDRIHLIAILVGTLGVIRLLAWPHFYFMLKSYVEPLAVFGVMCGFGVTQIQPDWVLALQVGKPIVLLAIGLWWLAAHIDDQTKTGALLRTRLALAVVVGAVVLAECSTELVYLFSQKIGQRVTCCTQFLDTSAAKIGSGAGPFHLVGAQETSTTVALFLVLQSLLITGTIILRQRAKAAAGQVSTFAAIMVLVIGMASLWATRWIWIDLVAPIVLELPYHHCIYELITDAPAFGLAAALAIAGHGCLCWPVALRLMRSGETDAVIRLSATIYGLCTIAIATELLIVAIHVA